jgi:hypothetical protein
LETGRTIIEREDKTLGFSDPRSRTLAVYRVMVLLLVGIWLPVTVAAMPLRMRYPEGLTHGFVNLSTMTGQILAHGELTQWFEGHALASRLTLHFGDGSLYDERERFSQSPVFRLLWYRLVQRGPAFQGQSLDYQFDRSGKFAVRFREDPSKAEQQNAGTTEIPDDVSNGLISVLLKNLRGGQSAIMHVMAFTPEPHVLDLHLTPEAEDRFWVGNTPEKATRFLIEPKVTGLTGILAKVAGKNPSPVRMWIAQGRPPTFVKFEGPLYLNGPIWRMEPSAPRWKQDRP